MGTQCPAEGTLLSLKITEVLSLQEFSWLEFAVIPGCVETAKLGALGHVFTLLRVFLQPQMFPVWVNYPSRLASPG